MSAVEGRTDMPLKRADLQRFYQFSGTDWLMCEPVDRRVRVSCWTWLTLGLWPMTALRQKLPFGLTSMSHVGHNSDVSPWSLYVRCWGA
jgi:hypothetical protein